MRLSVAVAVACLSIIGLCQADDVRASMIRRPTNIPAQALGSALQTLAKDRNFQVVYVSEEVNNLRTEGAVGDFTPDEALKQLLKGTGLTYHYLDEKTVTIMPVAATSGAVGGSSTSPNAQTPTSASGERQKEGQNSTAASFLVAQAAVGQTAGAPAVEQAASKPSSEGPVLEEVIVTAQKREEWLFDVPMSVSAITADEIVRRGAARIEDLQFSVPGMSITEFSPGQQRIQLRGISVFGGLPLVGVYLHEMPLNGEFIQAGMDVRLLDIERIEVLRGPQGTLYGQGSMGGTVRYIATEPKLDAWGGRFEAQGASINRGGVDWSTSGVINVPILQDHFAVRLAGDYEHFGGWVDETRLGISNSNDGKDYMLRATGLWRPSDPFSVSMLFQHQLLDLNDQNLANADGTVQNWITQPIRSRVDLADLTAKYDFGPAQLLSSTGWLDRRDEIRSDDSNNFIPFLEAPPPNGLGYPPGSIQSVAHDQINTNRIFTEELRLSTTGQTRLGGTVGAFYRDSRASTTQSEPVTPDIRRPIQMS